MTTYLGRIGDMIPVGCVSDAPVAHEQRMVTGGGAGTLAPRRVRVYGAGARDWSLSVSSGDFARANALQSLARVQARLGGAYRVIPCEAEHHNMLTPQASEELAGWENAPWSWRASFPEVEGAWADSIIPLTIPFIIGGTGGLMASGPRPAGLGKVTAGQTATSPLLPVIKPGEAYAAAYVSGSGGLRVRTYDGAGASTPLTVPFSGTAGVLQRITLAHTPAAGAVSVRLEVVATTDVHLAWPSYAHKSTPYTTGRGCDQAWVSLPSRTPVTATGKGLESHTYTIMEVGV